MNRENQLREMFMSVFHIMVCGIWEENGVLKALLQCSANNCGKRFIQDAFGYHFMVKCPHCEMWQRVA